MSATFQRINLVPQKPVSEKLKVVLPLVLILLLSIVLILIFIQYRFLGAKILSTERESTAIEEKQAQANIILASKEKLATEISVLTAQKEKLATEVGNIEAIRSKKRTYSKALNIISATLPPSIKCSKISFQKNNGVIEGIAVNYYDLPALVNNLKETDFIQFAVLNEVDKATGRESTLTFKISFGLD